MLKFLRKYQVLLLAVGGSLLMVVFLLQPVLTSFGQNASRSRRVATIGPAGSKVTAAEYDLARAEITAIQTIAQSLVTDPTFFQILRQDPRLIVGAQVDPGNEVAHWLLLKRAAKDAGLEGSSQAGNNYFLQMAAAYSQRTGGAITTAQTLQQLDLARDQLAQNLRGTRADVDRVVGAALAVSDLKLLVRGGMRSPEPVLLSELTDATREALVDYVVINASLFAADVPEPTDEDLAAFFEARDEVRPGDEEGDELGMGYLFPPRVKLEILTIDPSQVRAAVAVNPVDVRQRWRQDNPDLDSDRFELDRERVTRQIEQETVDRAVEIADGLIRGEMTRALLELERTGSGTYELPETWSETRPEPRGLAARIAAAWSSELGLELSPTITAPEGWQRSSDLAQLTEVQGAVYQSGPVTVPFSQLVSLVSDLGSQAASPVQVGVLTYDPPASDLGVQRKHYALVTEARGESPPDSIEEIREQLRADWKLAQGYERLMAASDGLRAVAETQGLGALEGVVPVAEGLSPAAAGLTPTRDARVRRGQTQRVVGGRALPTARVDSQSFRDTVIDASAALDPLVDIDVAVDPETLTVVAPQPGRRSVAIVKIRAMRPPSIEILRQIGFESTNALALQQLDPELLENDPFTFERLKERYEFEQVESKNDEA